MAPLRANPKRGEAEVDRHVRSLKNFGDATLADLAARFDLVILDHPHVGEATEGALAPLDQLLPAETLDAIASPSIGPSFESHRYADRKSALPIDAACQVASYRPDLLGDRPLPNTWPEAINLAQALRAGLFVDFCGTRGLREHELGRDNNLNTRRRFGWGRSRIPGPLPPSHRRKRSNFPAGPAPPEWPQAPSAAGRGMNPADQ